MSLIQIENKAAKVKLNDTVHKYSVDEVIEEIEKVYGAKAVEKAYAFGEVTACIENAVDTLEIEIHSPGGSVFEGYRIYNAMQELRERGVHVTAKINTLAASMGSVIAMAADKVTIASNGRIMIHDASAGVYGNADAIRKSAEMLEEISDEIAQIYAYKTGKDKDKMREMMKSETWISAKSAIEMGFADEIFDTKTKAMSILDKFRPDAALVEKVSGLESSLVDAENQINEISAKLEEAQNDLVTALTELTEAKASLETITNERADICAKLEEASGEIESLKAKLTAAEASAASKAAEILATAGVPALTDALENDNADAGKSLYAQYRELQSKDPVAAAKFWEENEKQIINNQ
jgi:ATP-dependent Clp endopeptidase proteolytic subunit ClpP